LTGDIEELLGKSTLKVKELFLEVVQCCLLFFYLLLEGLGFSFKDQGPLLKGLQDRSLLLVRRRL